MYKEIFAYTGQSVMQEASRPCHWHLPKTRYRWCTSTTSLEQITRNRKNQTKPNWEEPNRTHKLVCKSESSKLYINHFTIYNKKFKILFQNFCYVVLEHFLLLWNVDQRLRTLVQSSENSNYYQFFFQRSIYFLDVLEIFWKIQLIWLITNLSGDPTFQKLPYQHSN